MEDTVCALLACTSSYRHDLLLLLPFPIDCEWKAPDAVNATMSAVVAESRAQRLHYLHVGQYGG